MKAGEDMRMNKAEVRVERLRECLRDRALVLQMYIESTRRKGWVWAAEKAKKRRKKRGKERMRSKRLDSKQVRTEAEELDRAASAVGVAGEDLASMWKARYWLEFRAYKRMRKAYETLLNPR